MHISQLQIPATTPPTDGGAAGVLAWALGIALAVVGVIFWLREKGLAAQLSREQAIGAEKSVELGKAEVRIEALQKENRELRDARLADAQKQAENNKVIAQKFMNYERRDAALSERPGQQVPSPDDWGDIPTGVANAFVETRQQPQPRALTDPRNRLPRAPAIEDPYRPRTKSRHGEER